MIRMADPIFVDDRARFLSKLFNFPEAPVWRAPIVRTESCCLPLYVNAFLDDLWFILSVSCKIEI